MPRRERLAQKQIHYDARRLRTIMAGAAGRGIMLRGRAANWLQSGGQQRLETASDSDGGSPRFCDW